MATAILLFHRFSDVVSLCRSIYGQEMHEELEAIRDLSDLDQRDYIDLMLTTALPNCRIHHGRDVLEVENDFDNEADAVALERSYANL